MIKTLVKLVLAALVVNACWRSANVFMRYYKFKDGVHETALFASDAGPIPRYKRGCSSWRTSLIYR